MLYKNQLPILVIFFVSVLVFSAVSIVNGQQKATSNCVETKVGDPKGDQSPPEECDGGQSQPDEPPPSDGTPPNESCRKPPDNPSDLQKAIKDTFDITMTGFDNDHLKWAWDMLWCFSGTKFPSLVDGTTVEAVANVGDSRMSCNPAPCHIWIGQMPGRPTTFKFLLTHELGHVVNYANPREEIQWTAQENAFGQEGGISYYARNAAACTGSDNLAEDYADMIAYYMHPHAGETTPACDPDKSPPNPLFELKEFPLHLGVAEKILL